MVHPRCVGQSTLFALSVIQISPHCADASQFFAIHDFGYNPIKFVGQFSTNIHPHIVHRPRSFASDSQTRALPLPPTNLHIWESEIPRYSVDCQHSPPVYNAEVYPRLLSSLSLRALSNTMTCDSTQSSTSHDAEAHRYAARHEKADGYTKGRPAGKVETRPTFRNNDARGS